MAGAGHAGLHVDPHEVDQFHDIDRRAPGAERQLEQNARVATAGCFGWLRDRVRTSVPANSPAEAALNADLAARGLSAIDFQNVRPEDLPDVPNAVNGYTRPPAPKARVERAGYFHIGGDENLVANFVPADQLTGRRMLTADGKIAYELTDGSWVQAQGDANYGSLSVANQERDRLCGKCPKLSPCCALISVLVVLGVVGLSLLGAWLGGAFNTGNNTKKKSGVDPEPDTESTARDGGGPNGFEFDVIAVNSKASKVSGTVTSVVLITDAQETETTSIDVHSTADTTKKIGAWSVTANNHILFAPVLGTVIRPPDNSVTVQYKFTDSNGESNAGTVTLNFTNDPVAVNVTLPEATDATMPVRTDVVAAGFVQDPTMAAVTLNNPSSSKGTWGIDGTNVTFLPNMGVATSGTDSVSFTITAGTKSSKATATVSYNLAATGTRPVAMNVSLSSNDRTSLSSAQVGANLQQPGTVVTVGLQDPANPTLFTKSTVTKPGTGAWSVVNQPTMVSITFEPNGAFTGTTDSIPFKVSTTASDANGNLVTLTSQNSATATVMLPAIGQTLPTAPPINQSGGFRYQTTPVPTNASGVERVGDGNVTSSSGVVLGTWTVVNNAKNPQLQDLQFTPATPKNAAPGQVLVYQNPTTTVQYTALVNGQRTLPGTVTLTFGNSPAVTNISETKTTGTSLDLNVLENDSDYVNAYVAEGVAAFEANPKTKIEVSNDGMKWDSSAVASDGIFALGTWVADQTTGKITFTGMADPIQPNKPVSVMFRITDSQGNTSNTATATVNFKRMNVMVRARTMLMTNALVNGQSQVADIAAAHQARVDPKTVELVAAHPIGQSNFTDGVSLKKDRKQMVVPGQGIWSVDSQSGKISFLPDDDIDEGVMPVSYSFFDKDGNPSTTGLLVVDPDDTIRAAVNTAAQQTDTDFWNDFKKRFIDGPTQELTWDQLLVVVQSGFAVTDFLMRRVTPDPISQSAFDTGYQAWKKNQHNDTLFTICEKMASNVAANTTAPYQARFWRLKLMADMLTKALVDAGF